MNFQMAEGLGSVWDSKARVGAEVFLDGAEEPQGRSGRILEDNKPQQSVP